MNTKLKIAIDIIKEANKARPKASPKSKTKALSKKALAIQEFINNSDFGCKKDSVLGLMSLVTGEKLVTEKAVKSNLNLGTILRITANEAEHRFAINTLVIVCTSADFDEEHVVANDLTGTEEDANFLDSTDYVLATNEEVKNFIAAFKQSSADMQNSILKSII